MVGLSYLTNDIMGHKICTKYDKDNLRSGRNIQEKLAKVLCEKIGKSNDEIFSYGDIKKVENVLNIQVKVVNVENIDDID